MSSPAQVLANRQNAQRSTGPKSPEGKAAAAKNATRHGLSGASSVLAHESPEDFVVLAAAIHEEFQPASPNEDFLVGQMIQSRWKLMRIERLEALALEQILTEPGGDSDPDGRLLGALSKSGNILDKLQRYTTAAQRAYYKALHELQTSRVRSAKAEAVATDNYIQQYVNAPMPAASKPAVQNEPDLKPAAQSENLALRL